MTREPRIPPLAELDDDTLVVLLADAAGSHPAADVLLLRHLDWLRRRVAIDGAKLGLSPSDIEDAQQSLVLDIVPCAVASFRSIPPASSIGQSFRSFLRHVLRKRLCNFVRQLRRLEGHIDRSLDVYALLERGIGTCAGCSRQRPGCAGDPSRSVERCELFECLEAILNQLPTSEQLLWHLAVSQYSLGDIARALKIGYHTAKFRRQRFFAKIRRSLAGRFDHSD